MSQYKKLSDMPPQDLKALLKSAKSAATLNALHQQEGWHSKMILDVLLAFFVERAPEGRMRLRVLVSPHPQKGSLPPADEKALLHALEIESYVIERLPTHSGADALLITESWNSRSARERTAAHGPA